MTLIVVIRTIRYIQIGQLRLITTITDLFNDNTRWFIIIIITNIRPRGGDVRNNIIGNPYARRTTTPINLMRRVRRGPKTGINRGRSTTITAVVRGGMSVQRRWWHRRRYGGGRLQIEAVAGRRRDIILTQRSMQRDDLEQ